LPTARRFAVVIEKLSVARESLADRTPTRLGDDRKVDRGNAGVCIQYRVKRNRRDAKTKSRS